MEPSDLLRYVTTTLERLGLRYFVTGSVATIFFGEPRFTNDIDVVADVPEDRIRELCAAFPAEEFYLDEETVRRAVSRHVHRASGPSSVHNVMRVIPNGKGSAFVLESQT